jgi:hypothetical protein
MVCYTAYIAGAFFRRKENKSSYEATRTSYIFLSMLYLYLS